MSENVKHQVRVVWVCDNCGIDGHSEAFNYPGLNSWLNIEVGTTTHIHGYCSNCQCISISEDHRQCTCGERVKLDVFECPKLS